MSARRRWVWVDGRGLVEVPPDYKAPARAFHIGRPDTVEPFKSMANGRMYDSVSRYKADIKAQGYEIVGDEKRFMMDQPTLDVPDAEGDLRRTASELGMDI